MFYLALLIGIYIGANLAVIAIALCTMTHARRIK